MNLAYLNQYVLFAAVTVLIGLVVCKIICYSYPEMEKNHTNTHKYTCIIILAVVGLAMRWLITTQVGERYLYSEPEDRFRREMYRLRKETKLKILNYVKKIEELNKIKIPALPNLPEESEQNMVGKDGAGTYQGDNNDTPETPMVGKDGAGIYQGDNNQENTSIDIEQQQDSDKQPPVEQFRRMRG